MKKLTIFISFVILFSCNAGRKNENLPKDLITQKRDTMINKSTEDWKKELTPEQYYVIIEKGTERPFTGEYWNTFTEGTYKCAACSYELFDSGTKFDAHCGWPSFYDSIDKSRIKTAEDNKLGYKRIEIMCARCGAHLGHVFDDGPNPTGHRYCVNSLSIKLDSTKTK
jgi:methionine-R-sulfoxide reductase